MVTSFGDVFSMPSKSGASLVYDRLVYRSGDHSGIFTTNASFNCFVEAIQYKLGIFNGRLSRLYFPRTGHRQDGQFTVNVITSSSLIIESNRKCTRQMFGAFYQYVRVGNDNNRAVKLMC